MAVYGYARISTKKQKIERQIDNIKRIDADAIIFTEAYTGTTTDRPEWNKLYSILKDGDTIIFDEVSRMSRNAEEGFQLYQEMYSRGVNLIFVKEPHINTDVYKQTLQNSISMTGTDVDIILKAVNEYLMKLAERQIEIAFQTAQHEVEFLHKRTSEGVRRAMANGKQVGRMPNSKVATKKSIEAKAMIRKLSKDFNGKYADIDVMNRMNLRGLKISRNSYYKYKKEMKTA